MLLYHVYNLPAVSSRKRFSMHCIYPLIIALFSDQYLGIAVRLTCAVAAFLPHGQASVRKCARHQLAQLLTDSVGVRNRLVRFIKAEIWKKGRDCFAEARCPMVCH